MNRHRITLTALGIAIPALGYVGVHELFPGSPEHLSDAELVDWAAPHAHSIWLGGSLQVVAAVLLLTWGAMAASRIEDLGRSMYASRILSSSVQVTAALIGLAGLLQVTAGVLATPEEAYGSESVMPVTLLLAPNLSVAAWCFLAPAALAITATRAARWLRVVTAVLGILLVASFALPFVAWFIAFILLIIASAGLGTRPDEDDPAAMVTGHQTPAVRR